MMFGWRTDRRIRDAMGRVLSAAERAVAAGRYPTVEIALFEMASNESRAIALGISIREVLKSCSIILPRRTRPVTTERK